MLEEEVEAFVEWQNYRGILLLPWQIYIFFKKKKHSERVILTISESNELRIWASELISIESCFPVWNIKMRHGLDYFHLTGAMDIFFSGLCFSKKKKNSFCLTDSEQLQER